MTVKIGICLDFMGCGEMTQEDEYAEVENSFVKFSERSVRLLGI